ETACRCIQRFNRLDCELDGERLAAPALETLIKRKCLGASGNVLGGRDISEQDLLRGIYTRGSPGHAQLNSRKFPHALVSPRYGPTRDPVRNGLAVGGKGALRSTDRGRRKTGRDAAQ